MSNSDLNLNSLAATSSKNQNVGIRTRSGFAASEESASENQGNWNVRSGTFLPVWIIWSLVAVQHICGIASPQLGTLVGCGVVLAIIWLARADYLPALIMTQPSPADFGIGEGWSTLSFAGFPLNLNYMLAMGLVARVTWELIVRPQTFRGVYWMMGVWYFTMGPAMIMALMGRAEGNPSWTSPIRVVWMFGAFFFGLILARTWRADGRIITRGLLPVAMIIILFVVLGFFLEKLRFIAAPAAVPLAFFAWQKGGTINRTLAVIVLLLGTMQGLGFILRPGEEEMVRIGNTGEKFGVGGTTLTSNGLFFCSLLLTFAVTWGRTQIRFLISRALGIPLFVFLVAFSLTIGSIGAGSWDRVNVDNKTLSLQQKVEAKLFADRGRIWNTALSDATSPPYILKPTGRPIWIQHQLWGTIEWTAGAHNSVLNTLLNHRWLNGTLLLLFLAAVMKRNASALSHLSRSGIHALAITVAVTAVIGMVTNDYPVDTSGAFWFFGFAGIVTRASFLEQQRSRSIEAVQVPSIKPGKS